MLTALFSIALAGNPVEVSTTFGVSSFDSHIDPFAHERASLSNWATGLSYEVAVTTYLDPNACWA